MFGLVGVHGGAGTTTVGSWLAGSGDPSVQAVELAPGMHLPPGCVPVVVARFTAYGMLQAARYLGSWPPGLPRPWLVVVRDAPLPPPKAAVYRRRALGARVVGVSEVPYLFRLRAVDSPETATQNFRAVRRAAARLRADLGVE